MLDIWESIGMLEGLEWGRFARFVFRQLRVTLFSRRETSWALMSSSQEKWIMNNRVG